MSIFNTIQEAQNKGADSTSIVEQILSQNPDKVSSITNARNKGANDSQILSEIQKQNQPSTLNKVGSTIADFGVGFAKKTGETLQNVGKLITTPLSRVTGLPEGGFTDQQLERVNTAQKVGAFASDVAQFAIPSSRISALSKTIGLGTKATLGSRVVASGLVATAQEGELGKESLIAAGSETLFPVAGAGAKVVSRLFKGLGSATSGVGTEAIESIIKNPSTARNVVKKLQVGGSESVVRENSNTILTGVRTIRKEARARFGEAIDTLKAVDIKPKTFRNNLQPFFDNYGISTSGKNRILDGVEFEKQSLLNKASSLVDDISNSELNGKSLRNIFKKIENSKFKTTGTDTERLSFNAFLNDMGDSVRKSIGQSTTKLDNINADFSSDMQLVEGVEKIFGKMKFYNEKELITASERLSQLFNKKGLAPSTINKFLTRIGVSPEDFRTTEAVRQISEKEITGNSVGTGIGELLKTVTSSIVTPEMVRDVAIKTGITAEKLAPALNALEPAARPVVLTTILELFDQITQ